jgi:His/Glu/Gln/Arg/opine family amino acid ABC transporter permease subunit
MPTANAQRRDRIRAPGALLCAITIVLLALAGSAAGRQTLTVALTGKYPPFSFYDENAELIGFDVDVSRTIAKHIDRDLDIVTTEWDGILAGLLAGKYDAIIGSMAVTEERAQAVDFSDPYYISGAQLFVRSDLRDNVEGVADCTGLKIGVGLGETYEHYIRRNHPEVTAVAYKAAPDIFQDLENRRLAGFVTDRLVGLWQIRNAGKDFEPAGDLLYEERIAIPVRKGNTGLLDEINSALAAMKSEGELDALHEKWFGRSRTTGQARIKSSVIARRLLQGFLITLGVAATSIAIGFLLAIPGGVVLNRNKGPLYFTVRSVVNFLRGTPVLIQLFFVYFGAPQIGIRLSPITSAIVTLSINTAAYMSEVVRSGLMSVDPGQAVAGQALGLTRLQVFRLVIWPQAFRIAIPPLMNSVVALTKDTALISVISVSEVIREAQSIISVTFNPIKYYLIVALMFFAVTFPLMKLAERLEQRIRERGFVHD